MNFRKGLRRISQSIESIYITIEYVIKDYESLHNFKKGLKGISKLMAYVSILIKY